MRLSRLLLVALLAPVLGSCADDAILELELLLPPIPADFRGYAYLETLSADHVDASDFEREWAGGAIEDGFTLGSMGSTEDVSVVATGPSIARMLGVRVRFCFDSRCAAPQDRAVPREARWIFERAFYGARRVHYRLAIDAVPDAEPGAPVMVSRCQIGHGCRGGSSITDPSFCVGERHDCE